MACYRRMANGSPRSVEGWAGMGEVYSVEKRPRDAVEAFRRAIAIEPQNGRLHVSLGHAFHVMGEPDQARASFAEGARLTPDRPSWQFRHLGYMPQVFPDEEAIDRYFQDLDGQLGRAIGAGFDMDWRECLKDGFCPPFGLPHHGRPCRALLEKYAAMFDPRFFQGSRHTPCAVRQGSKPGRTTTPLDAAWRPEGRETDRLRIGFLVTAGREHGFLRNMTQIVAGLDPERFEAIVICPIAGMTTCQQAIPASHVQWVPLPDEFERAVEAVRASRCDILYHRQIGTSLMNYFLPFARCAPIQCTAWGSHGTTGIEAVDYYLSSDLIELDEADSHYTERLYRFRNTFPTYQTRKGVRTHLCEAPFGPFRQMSPDPFSRSDFDLPNRGALYFCPQRIEKVHPAFDRLLRGILETDSQGTVVMFQGRHPAAFDRLVTRFNRTLGPKLLRRVTFVENLPNSEYYRLLSLADAVLDAPNYSACLTGFDAFSLGIPLVTLPGKLKVQRYALALCRKMGIGDLIVEDESQYITTAVRLGTDDQFGQDIRHRIRQRSHFLFDDTEAIKEHERFFEYAWQHCR